MTEHQTIQKYYLLRDKTLNFAITNDTLQQEALELYKEINDNFEEIYERYNLTHFTNKLDEYLN